MGNSRSTIQYNSVFLASESGSCYILLSHMANIYIYIYLQNNIFIYHTYHIYIYIHNYTYMYNIYIWKIPNMIGFSSGTVFCFFSFAWKIKRRFFRNLRKICMCIYIIIYIYIYAHICIYNICIYIYIYNLAILVETTSYKCGKGISKVITSSKKNKKK